MLTTHSLPRFAAALLFTLPQLPAQVNKKTTDGIVPYTVQQGAPRGSYHLDDFDSVSVYSGKLNVSVPLLTLGARGQAGYTVSARVSIPPWTAELELKSSPCESSSTYYYDNKATSYWWTAHRARFGPGMVVIKRSGWEERGDSRAGGDPILYFGQTYSHIVFLAPDGTEHALHENRAQPVFSWIDSTYTLPPAERQRQNFRSLDSPGLTFRADTALADTTKLSDMANDEVSLNVSGWLRFPDGMRYRVDLGKISFIEDRNGNRMLFTYESFQDAGAAGQQIFTNRITKATDSIGRETTFEYGVLDKINGTDVIVDRIQYLGGASGTSLRKILVERKPVINQLMLGVTASTNLFPGLSEGGTNVIAQQVISRIAFDNNTNYTFFYNEFGEVARVRLPTGGRVDYAHGPGVATGTGVFGGGRVLSTYYNAFGGGTSQCGPRPTGSPIWQPIIYRRLLTRSVYPSEFSTLPEKVSDYRNGESVASGQCYNGGTTTCSYMKVTVTFPGYLETRETAQNNLAAPDKVHRQFFHPGNPFAEGLANGPLDRMLKEKASQFAALVAYPDPLDGKETKTETGTGIATFAPLQRSESVFLQVADGSVRPCQQRQTWINGGASKSSLRLSVYDALPVGGDNQIIDPANGPLNGALAVKFSNLTDLYEYDWDTGPAFGTCAAPTANYLRRTRYQYQSNATPAYRQWDSHLLQLPSLMTVYGPGDIKASESTYAYDQTSRTPRPNTVNHVLPSPSAVRGNLTSLSRRIDAGTVATVQRQYDDLGNITAEIDPKGGRTDYSYDEADYVYAVPNTYGFLTAIDRPVVPGLARQRTSWRINYRSGAVTRMTAPNGTVTNYEYQDPLDRLTLAERAVGLATGNLVTSYQYVDTAGSVKVTGLSDRYTANDLQRATATCYDGFGRDTRTVAAAAGSTIVSGKVYDGFGRVVRTYNPATTPVDCASALSAPSTVVQYDALDRPLTSTSPGGAVTEITYNLNETTTKDPAGKYRRQARDALGRLTAVTEDPLGSSLLTTYGYDAEGRLTSVNQGTQVRSFTYDLAGRLLTATNPENGLISYTYDLNGNLVSRLDARNAITCYGVVNGITCDGTTGYDALNRPLVKRGVNGAQSETVIYCYDGRVKSGTACGVSEIPLQRGMLTSVGNANSDTSYTFDAVGRLTQSTQTTVGLTAKTFTYGYYRSDLRGEILYPSNRRVVTCADGLLRPIWVSAARTMADCQASAAVSNADTYAHSAQYATHGAITQLSIANGLLESTGHNLDLQPDRMRLGTVAGATPVCGQPGDTWCLQFTYGTPAANNGNITAQQIHARKSDGSLLSLQQTYSYDALNRLTDLNETVQAGGTGTWWQTNQYDRYGNRWATASVAQHVMTPSQPAWLSTANNRVLNSSLGSLTYDSAGNLTNHPQMSGVMTYDADNRLTGFGSAATYFYDGEGRRVKRSVNGVDTYYVYDGTGALAGEYGGVSSAIGRRYLTQDHLGSTRVITDATGAVKSRCDYLPFGDQIMAIAAQGNRDQIPEYACTESDVTQKFTSKERDAETGLDFFQARYMSAAQGRFTSPDVPFADQWEKNPQSWNLYSYARNNPLRFVDPTGRCSQAAGGYTDEGSGLFPGPCSGGTIGDSNNNTNSVTVTGKKGNAVGAFVLNALFALDSTANNYFAWMFKERPKLLENTPTTKEFVGQAAAATVLVGTMMIGPSGGAQAPLRLIHSEATLSKTILDGLRKKSTQEIIDTLKPGLEEGLKVKPDGRVMDGNHRIKVLMERGVDVNSLPREVLK